ncbi:MAG: DUF927 domain-containing protein [Tepidibacter sp.]|jgi:uncharacterized protein (DUF927 family)|uniref:DUF927 domain-containing protein n=1 Tax=Tepidibacter sp. TaxID=2529387 RepID=UPI0025D0688F|nr:DUF927 domain-containing protein [Tepidibacter sp.]MCT4508653.1 DUF927 domain-containing protein [Tepidibacter sp.]MCT4585455.1 DUF927 domain-containing protein [Peptostreptococcaceae bacterium]
MNKNQCAYTFSKLYDDVYVKDAYIYSIKSKNDIVIHKPVAQFMSVKKAIEDVETKKEMYELEFMSNRRMKKIQVGKKDLASRANLLSLAEYGVDVNDLNVKEVMKHLRNEIDNLKVSFIHRNVGFEEDEDKKVYFKHYKAIGYKEKSKYSGNLAVEPKGSEENWMRLIKDEVVEDTKLALALILGFSAATVGFVGEELSIESLLVHIFAESTHGKTTAAQLAVSPFGSPKLREQGLILDWNSTQNAIFGLLSGNRGLPMVLDESSMLNKKDFTNLIYILASGSDKKRMNKKLEVRPTKTWETTIISTGESSILSQSNKNTGLKVRLFEFGNIKWTKDSKQAEKIKSIVTNNYGFTGIRFVKKLLDLGKDEVIRRIMKWKSKIEEDLKENSFKGRIAMKLAIIVATGQIVNEALNIKLNLKKIKAFIIDNENKSIEDIDLPSTAYDHFKQSLVVNKSKLNKDFGDTLGVVGSSTYELWGKLEKNKHENYVVIITTKFDEIMKKGGFENTRYILQAWKDRNLLSHEKGKLYRRRIVDPKVRGAVPCYVIKLQNGDGKKQEDKKKKAKKDDKKDAVVENDESKVTKQNTSETVEEDLLED